MQHQVYYIPDAVVTAARFSPQADAGNMSSNGETRYASGENRYASSVQPTSEHVGVAVRQEHLQ